MSRKAQFQVDFKRLLPVSDYRAFLNIYFEAIDPRTGTKRSYAQFAREAGFRSRSYPRDIVVGKRRLTAKTAPAFARALDLPKDWKELFRLLVALEERDSDPNREERAEIVERINHVRERLSRKTPRTDLSPKQSSDIVDRLCEFPELPRVYAALGSDEVGSGRHEIIQKTGLMPDHVDRSLARMQELKLAEKIGPDRWVPLSFHVALVGVQRSEFFRQMFVSALKAAEDASRHLMDSEQDLFITSAICVRAELLPKLKSELKEFLLKFVDNAESPRGDTVTQLICSLHR